VSHGRRRPNCSARRTQREAPISRQASTDARTCWAGGSPAATSSLGASWFAPPRRAVKGVDESPRAGAPLGLCRLRRIPATLLAPPAPLAAALLGGIDLVAGDAFVEGTVAQRDRLGVGGAPRLGGKGVARRQQPLLQLGGDAPVQLGEHVVAGGAQLGELMAEDTAPEDHALEGGRVVVVRRGLEGDELVVE